MICKGNGSKFMKNRAEKTVKAELCVIGGGIAGMCAAISAARHGVKVALIHDRPVLGGNASSEIRMWIRGAASEFPEYREGGIIEEIALENMYVNPEMSYGNWDAVLYGKVIAEPNISLFLNTSCLAAEEKDGKILSVTAWQLTSYTFIKVEADYFADCSGDSVLADCTSAEYRSGREGKDVYGEQLAPNTSDAFTMGNSCLIQARETDHEIKFVAPDFAYKFKPEDFKARLPEKPEWFNMEGENFWWIELGGCVDALRDAEKLNKDLLARAYGVWDFIKNSGYYDCKNWELEWIGFLAGKRETRRYVGDYTLTENDVAASVEFEDGVAYGGWTMDDHNPYGMDADYPNKHHRFEKPYAIPYRCLYSANIENLFFAGRNISVSHMALSSTRVMATCGIIGQAVGTACCIAKKYSVEPRGVLKHIDELKQTLRDDDCYLLHYKRKISESVKNAKFNLSDEDVKKLLEPTERTLNGIFKPVELKLGEELTAEFGASFVQSVRIVFDSDLPRICYDKEGMYVYRGFPSRCCAPLKAPVVFVPPALTKEYELRVKADGKWETVMSESENRKRLAIVPINKKIEGVALICKKTYGEKTARLFSIDVL